jgi:tRNA threonylcarbamoyl adenosine modification protein YjeE
MTKFNLQKKTLISSENEMVEFAKKIAEESLPNDLFLLLGTLGSGKTFFARNFINSISEKKIEVLSPTFNLVSSYQTKKGELFHFDLYRLKNESELENIGFFDAIKSGICLIEWPEIALNFLSKKAKIIEIKIVENLPNSREIWM